MLNFTMHAAGNELIFFYRYCATIRHLVTVTAAYRGITVIFYQYRGITAFPITVSL